MRIGVLTTSYPRYPNDYAGNFVAELTEWLTQEGDELEVLAPAPAKTDHPHIKLRSLQYAFSPRLFYRAGAPDNLQQVSAWLQLPTFLTRLALECYWRSRRWDAVISHWLVPCGLVASLATHGIPHLTIAHSSDVHLLNYWGKRPWPWGRNVLHRLARPRTRLILTSEALRPMLAKLAVSQRSQALVREAPVMRMGIPSTYLPATNTSNQRQQWRNTFNVQGRTVVLFIGRLVPVKGAHILIQACADLPNLLLVIIGDGPERAKLEQQALAFQVPTLFLGERVGSAKDAWLHAADLLVLPSISLPDGRTDSAPRVLLEAMAVGLPIIASEVGGNAEVIECGKNGLLIAPGDVASLRNAIQQLVSNAALRNSMGQWGQATVEQFTWDHLGAKMRQELLSL